MPLDPHLEGLLKMLAANPKPAYAGTLAEARAGYVALAHGTLKDSQFAPVRAVETLAVEGHAGMLPARVYRPDADGPTPTIAFFHGGGFVLGDLDTHDNMCRELCRGAAATVVSVAYRLAPEHPYPAAAEDAIAATRWVLANVSHLGGAGEDSVAVAGDSAGGNLATVAAQALAAEGVRLAGQFLIYPTVDATPGDYPSYRENGEGYFLDAPTMAWFGAQYMGEHPDIEDPRLSPLRAKDLSRLPPTLIITAEFDPLRDQGAAYADALAKAGATVELMAGPGMIHGFFSKGHFSPGAQRLIAASTRQFGALLRGAPAAPMPDALA